jgi:hypothetical protein
MGFGHFKNVQNGPLAKQNAREIYENSFLLGIALIFEIFIKCLLC